MEYHRSTVRRNKDILDRKRSFLVVTLSNGIQVDPQTERTNAFIQQRGILNEFTPDYRVRGFGLKHFIDVLLLAPSLQKIARERKIYLHGFGHDLGRGHWNQNGHRAAGEIIAAYLCNANIPFRVTSIVVLGFEPYRSFSRQCLIPFTLNSHAKYGGSNLYACFVGA